MKLSILTPAVPSRFSDTTFSAPPRQGALELLMHELEKQIGNLPVEHLILCDNKRRTVGEKRDAILRIARGDYVAFVDDDDFVSGDYVSSLLGAMDSAPNTHRTTGPDVITFRQRATVNGHSGEVEFRLGNPNEPFTPDGVTRRNAWHVCAWRRSLAVCSSFPANNYGEDWAYASRLCAVPGLREAHIPRVLHHYHHSSATTEAPPPG